MAIYQDVNLADNVEVAHCGKLPFGVFPQPLGGYAPLSLRAIHLFRLKRDEDEAFLDISGLVSVMTGLLCLFGIMTE